MCHSLNSLPYANYVRVAPGTSPTDDVHTLTTIHSTQTTYKTVTLTRVSKSLPAPPQPTPVSTEPEESTTTVTSTSTVDITTTITLRRSSHSTLPGPATITGYLSVTIPTELVPSSTKDYYTIETSVPGDTLTDGTYTSWGATSESLGDTTISTSIESEPTITSGYDVPTMGHISLSFPGLTLTDGTYTSFVATSEPLGETTTSTSINFEPTMSSDYDFPTISPSLVDGTTTGIFYSKSGVSSGNVGTTYVHPTSVIIVTVTGNSTPAQSTPDVPTTTSADSSMFFWPTGYLSTTTSAADFTSVEPSDLPDTTSTGSGYDEPTFYGTFFDTTSTALSSRTTSVVTDPVPAYSDATFTYTASDATFTFTPSDVDPTFYGTFSRTTSTLSDGVATSFDATSTESSAEPTYYGTFLRTTSTESSAEPTYYGTFLRTTSTEYSAEPTYYGTFLRTTSTEASHIELTFSEATSTATDAVPTSFDATSTESDGVATSFDATSTESGYAVPTFSKRAVEGKAVNEKQASVIVASFAALVFTLLAAAFAV